MPLRAKSVVLALGIAAAHFVLMTLSFAAVIAGAVGGHPHWWAVLLGRLFIPLGFPGTFIVGNWMPSLLELSNGATLAVAVGTSLLWGVTITALWLWWRSRR